MATQAQIAKLTERQKEIHGLVEQGKTAPEIAKRLGISDNGVYQQIRNIRKALGTAPSAASKRAAAARKATGKPKTAKASTAKPGRKPGRKSAAKPKAAPAPKAMTAEGLLQSELDAIKSAVESAQEEIARHEQAASDALTRVKELEAEREIKADVLAVLKGEKRAVAIPTPKPDGAKSDAPKPAVAKPPVKANGTAKRTGAKDGSSAPATPKGATTPAKSAAKPQAAPQAPQAGKPSAPVTPPSTQAERESSQDDFERTEAERAQAAAEAPQEPVSA